MGLVEDLLVYFAKNSTEHLSLIKYYCVLKTTHSFAFLPYHLIRVFHLLRSKSCVLPLKWIKGCRDVHYKKRSEMGISCGFISNCSNNQDNPYTLFVTFTY